MSEALFDLICVVLILRQLIIRGFFEGGSVDLEDRNSRRSKIECDRIRDATCDWSGVTRKNILIAAIKHIGCSLAG